jgi:hypothetical protein
MLAVSALTLMSSAVAGAAAAGSPSPSAVLAYVTQSRSGRDQKVELTNVDGSDTRLLGPGTTAAVAPDSENLADAISKDGSTVLFTNGFEGSPTSVERIPFGGGKATVLVRHGASASWNA